MRNLATLSLLFTICFSACIGNTDYAPKRTGYFRISMPERKYVTYNSAYPFTFDCPTYATIEADSTAAHPYSLNIVFPRFRCTIYLSYFTLDNNLNDYLGECRKFLVEHEVKASAINEQAVSNPKAKIYGVIYDIEGNAASNMQFYLTDSTRNFVRGAMYFYAVPNKDSLEPVATFIKEDINHLVQTFRWKNQN